MKEKGDTDIVKKDKDMSFDKELFLSVFEKPIQMYRYLRVRSIMQPTFLHRNLTYMTGRSSRNNKSRKTFKLNQMLPDKEKNRQVMDSKWFLNIGFAAYIDEHSKENAGNGTKYVLIEAIMEKMCHKRRKESLSKETHSIGNVSVMANGHEEKNRKIPALHIPVSDFQKGNDMMNCTYVLRFFVDRDGSSHGSDDSKSITSLMDTMPYGVLPVIDKHGKCELPNGDYTVTLTEPTMLEQQRMGWFNLNEFKVRDVMEEPQDDFAAFEAFERYSNKCVIKIHIRWSDEAPDNGYMTYMPFIDCVKTEPNEKQSKLDRITKMDDPEKGQVKLFSSNVQTAKISEQNKEIGEAKKDQKPKYCLQFIYGINKQKTEHRRDFVCPLCSINCKLFYSLLKHFKCCHARMIFTYVPQDDDIPRVDVTVNELYDGSYVGEVGHVRQRPMRRKVCTYFLVERPRRLPHTMTEFLDADEYENELQRPYIIGHNRTYYHTESCLPIPANQLEYDSEKETDPKWLQRKTKQMIDEFTDVNEGEKELMKLWNLHIMKYNFVGDCQLPLACDMFIQEHGEEIIEKQLFRNFMAHMAALYDFGLVSPEIVYKNLQSLHKMLKKSQHLDQLKKTRAKQVAQWELMEAAKEEKIKKMKIEPSYVNVEKIDPSKLMKTVRKSAGQEGSPTKIVSPMKSSITGTKTTTSEKEKSTNTPNKVASTTKTTQIESARTPHSSAKKTVGEAVSKSGPRAAVKRKLSTGLSNDKTTTSTVENTGLKRNYSLRDVRPKRKIIKKSRTSM